MKCYLISIIALMVMAVGTVHAQSVNIGTKIGLNSYTITNDSGPDFDSKVGLHAGLIGHVHLSSQLGLQPEFYYSMRGAKSGNTNFNLEYINVPVLFQYMFDSGFRLQAGPQVAFLVRSKMENSGSTMDLMDGFKTIDAGLSFGAGYIHMSSGFGIDARYNLGLSDISESSSVVSNSRGFQIGIFYLFNHID